MSDGINFTSQLRRAPGIRLAVLFGSFFVMLIVVSILDTILNQFSFYEQRDKLLTESTIQSVLAFCVPAYIVSRFCSDHSAEWLSLKRSIPLRGFVGVIAVYVLSLPAMECLITWNADFHLPAAFSNLEATLREWEESSLSVTNIILGADTPLEIISGILIIGILTGFSEELFFRAGLQGILDRSGMGRAYAVIIAATIFSAMHFQFFGFFPRLLMGLYFGYLLVWSRSVWLPVFAHALNNSMVVITAGLTGDENFEIVNRYGELGSFLLPAISVALTVWFFMRCRNYFFENSDKTT